MTRRKSKDVWQFGDFQTPQALATTVCQLLKRTGITPDNVIEPTCGRGAFVKAAADAFPAAHIVGIDLNSDHLRVAREKFSAEISADRLELCEGDFFGYDWASVFESHPGSWLILGNPPWVTSAELGSLSSTNLPPKSNFQGRSGIEAITGKSNFDISEWMLLCYMDWLRGRNGWVAVLVKTVVARKVLAHVWKARYPVVSAALYSIDAMRHFGAAVEACLFVLVIDSAGDSFDCSVFESLSSGVPSHTLGFHNGILIANTDAYQRWQHLAGRDRHYVWRSGIKHDCSSIMEFRTTDGYYLNGLNEEVLIEDALVYPLLKSSDVNNNAMNRGRFMLVPQKTPGEDTRSIQVTAPRTWEYLQRHASVLANRASAIYRNRPQFSIFGVGEYTFAPWKVAISGFYKSLRFVSVGPFEERPTVFDDTVYFLPCRSHAEASFLADLLNSAPAQEFYSSMVFWSDKRPITNDLLKRLDIGKLAAELGAIHTYESFVGLHYGQSSEVSQLSMFNHD